VHRHHFFGVLDGAVVTDAVAAAAVDVIAFVVAVRFVIVAGVAFGVLSATIYVGSSAITVAIVVVTIVLAVALNVAV